MSELQDSLFSLSGASVCQSLEQECLWCRPLGGVLRPVPCHGELHNECGPLIAFACQLATSSHVAFVLFEFLLASWLFIFYLFRLFLVIFSVRFSLNKNWPQLSRWCSVSVFNCRECGWLCLLLGVCFLRGHQLASQFASWLHLVSA